MAIPLKATFFSHSSRLEGADRSLLELVTDLIANYQVACTVILPYDGPLKQKLEQVGAGTRTIPYSWWCDDRVRTAEETSRPISTSFEALLGTLHRELAAINPDVVVTNTMVIPWGALAASFLGKPHVWHIREFGELDHDLKFFLPFDRVLRIITESSNVIVTNSNAVRETLFGSRENALTVYNSIAVPAEVAASVPEQHDFKKPASTKLIIAGTIAKSKGQEDAILAVKELVRRNRDIELIIMGTAASPPYLQELHRLVASENLERFVSFLEFKENPYTVLRQADIVLVCSKNEAFGRVTVEAMLLKKPVIGTDAGGTRELIRDGYNGLLYQPANHLQLAEKIEYLMDNAEQIEELGNNGYAFARERFTREEYGGKIHRILDGLRGSVNPMASAYQDFVNEAMLAVHAKQAAEQENWNRERAQSEHEAAALQAKVHSQSETILALQAQQVAQQEAWSEERAQKEHELSLKQQELSQKEDELSQKEDELSQKEHEAATLQAQLESLTRDHEEAVRYQAALESRVESLEKEIAAIKNMSGWVLLEKYRHAKSNSKLLSFVHGSLLMPVARLVNRRAAGTRKAG